MPSTTFPPNIHQTGDEDGMDGNLEHSGVHVDVNSEIPNDSLQPEMVG